MSRVNQILRRMARAALGTARVMMVPETPTDAGAISYFTLFALFPAMLVLIAITDSFLGWLELHDRILETALALFPGSKAFLEANLKQLTTPSPTLLISCLLAIIWSSTWIFTAVENALNRAWDVSRRRSFWESRIRSIALLVLGGILLLIAAGITGVVSTLRSQSTDLIPAFAQDPIINGLWSLILLSIGFSIAIIVFLLIYKLMPDRRVLWHEALSGAVVAATLWEMGSYSFAKLVPFLDPQQVYGRTAAIILLLTWVYTSSLIMLFGAGFSAHLHQPSMNSAPRHIKYEVQSSKKRVRSFAGSADARKR